MTQADDLNNMVLGAGAQEFTAYVTSFEEIQTKVLIKITSPQSSANWDSGPKTTKIVDLLRVEVRFVVTAYVENADKDKLKDLHKNGGTFPMTWEGTEYDINTEKISMKKTTKDGEQLERTITFTAIKGVNL